MGNQIKIGTLHKYICGGRFVGLLIYPIHMRLNFGLLRRLCGIQVPNSAFFPVA
ncbi:MAG: hypothetical protein NZ611_06140 [Bacteroidia bacterium]|nr:hypothetical protein [Bacteroidia bacterium]